MSIIGYRPRTAPAPRKPPGRLEQAARRKARDAAPYAAVLVITAAITLLLRSLLPFGIGLGITGTLIAVRLLEAVDVRRGGGRRAARQRRKYQGHATWRDPGKHLSCAGGPPEGPGSPARRRTPGAARH